MFRSRRWAELLDLIEGLPSHSRVAEAQLNDPEWAEHIVADQIRAEEQRRQTGEPDPKWSPRISEWDLHAVLLRDIRETLVAVRQSLYATTYLPDGKGAMRPIRPPSAPPQIPVPQTEVDRIKAERTRRAQLEIIALFAPHALTAFGP